ncbi:unnamed protein product [Blepharisma stoltei]|uniref:Uncharacterized protein n=1 Tax=Blepharisma stoltei TaxID=1481888 RepID=A0AAU9IS71_9CILI|nr:unnamed protein product [Blepharisma stoltei]
MQSGPSPNIDLTLLSSMLSDMNSKSFPDLFPTSLTLPPIKSLIDTKPEEDIEMPPQSPVQSLKAKRRRKTQKITACQHQDKKHYARGMCNSCYHRYGRETYAWLCEHTKRKLYAKGMCEPCYNKQHAETGTKIRISKTLMDSYQTTEIDSI